MRRRRIDRAIIARFRMRTRRGNCWRTTRADCAARCATRASATPISTRTSNGSGISRRSMPRSTGIGRRASPAARSRCRTCRRSRCQRCTYGAIRTRRSAASRRRRPRTSYRRRIASKYCRASAISSPTRRPNASTNCCCMDRGGHWRGCTPIAMASSDQDAQESRPLPRHATLTGGWFSLFASTTSSGVDSTRS